MPIGPLSQPGASARKPSTPTSVSASANPDGTSTVSFTPSTNPGKPSGNYVVTSSPGSITATGATSPIIVSGLTPGTSYTFTVVKQSGTGISSDTSAPSGSGTAFTIPGAPVISAARFASQTIRITLTTAAADNGSTVTSYEYRIKAGAGAYGSYATLSGSAPFIAGQTWDISGLTNGTTYTVQVRAVNAAGPGPGSNEPTAVPSGTPLAPTITLARQASQTVRITLTALAPDNGSAVTGYRYRIKAGAGAYGSYIALSGTAPFSIGQTWDIGSLTNGTTYTVQVLGVNANGDGDGSNEPTAIPYDVPSFNTETQSTTAVAPTSNSTTSFSNVSTTTATLSSSMGTGATFKQYERTVGTGGTTPTSSGSLTGLTQKEANTWRVVVTNTSSTNKITSKVIPNGNLTTVSVVFGPTVSYGSSASVDGTSDTTQSIGSGITEQLTAWTFGNMTSASVFYRITATNSAGTQTKTGSFTRIVSDYSGGIYTTGASFTTYGTYSYNSIDHGISMGANVLTGYANITSISGVLVGAGAGGHTTVTAYGSGGGGGGQYVTYSGRSTSTSLSLSRGAAGAGGQYGNPTTLTDSAGSLYGNAGTPGGGATGGQGGASPTGPGTYNFGYNPPSADGIGGGGGGAGGAAVDINGGAAFSGYGGGGPGYYDFGGMSFGYGTATDGPGRGGSGKNGSGTDGYWSVTYIGPAKN